MIFTTRKENFLVFGNKENIVKKRKFLSNQFCKKKIHVRNKKWFVYLTKRKSNGTINIELSNLIEYHIIQPNRWKISTVFGWIYGGVSNNFIPNQT